MKKAIAGACAAVMAFTSFSAATVPVSAAQLQISSDAQFITVQDRGGWDRDRDGRRGFESRGNDVFYNGHRGSRERRSGWQQRDGFWFPPEAFAGALIGGILGGVITSQNNNSSNQRTVRITREHLEWCEDRYRSYRASDNSFQPYNGPRQQCVSPYLR